MQIRNITPNHTGSSARRCTIGMKIGSVISIMLTWSTKTPRKMSMPIMPAMIADEESPKPSNWPTSPLLAPENDRICANVVAPTMMNRMMVEIATVPRSAANRFLKVSAR